MKRILRLEYDEVNGVHMIRGFKYNWEYESKRIHSIYGYEWGAPRISWDENTKIIYFQGIYLKCYTLKEAEDLVTRYFDANDSKPAPIFKK